MLYFVKTSKTLYFGLNFSLKKPSGRIYNPEEGYVPRAHQKALG